MKTMVVWSLKPGGFNEAVRRFLAGEAKAHEALTMLGRWHSVDLSVGFTLFEGDSPAAHYASAAKWADIMDFKSYTVIEDAEAGTVLASLKK